MTDHPPIRLIAIDLDGTLLNSQHQASPRNIAALKAAIEKGVQVVIATGKTHSSAREIIPLLGLSSPGVFVQGLVIHNPDGSVRSSIVLEPEIVQSIVDFADQYDLVAVAYSNTRLLIRDDHPALHVLSGHGEPEAEIVGPLTEFDAPINKFILFGDNDHLLQARKALTMQLNGRVTMVQALAGMLEILPPGTSKGAGLQRVLDELGIPPESVLAIGDGENDAEMLRMAGIGVAMANAMPEAMAAADYVVSSNDEDGVAEAVERFVLNSK